MTRIITKDEHPAFQKSVEALTNPVGSALRSLNDTLGKTLTERREERIPGPIPYTAAQEYRAWNARAFAEGQVARFTGETLDRCHYPRGHRHFDMWREGWAEADEEMTHMTAEEVRQAIADITHDELDEPEPEWGE